jgi:SAM-dependent methyltransferase
MADQATEGILSPWLRNQRFKAVLPYLKGHILDYGCGSGGLAKYIQPDFYLGVELDSESIQKGQAINPEHSFVNDLSEVGYKFDTIVALAVIEHVTDPTAFLNNLKQHLSQNDNAQIVITTPHPAVDWVHDIGAAVGLFSKHANDEHEDLLDEEKLRQTGKKCDLGIVEYKRFLLGANQLAVFKRSLV